MTLIPTALRDAVVMRAGNRCEYCQLPQSTQAATFPIDHVLPVTEAGETALPNLALACPRCNAAKWTHVAGADPVTGETLHCSTRAHRFGATIFAGYKQIPLSWKR